MANRRITQKELNKFAYIMLGFFAAFIMTPLRDWVSNTFNLHPAISIIFGILGVLGVLWLFKL